MLGNFYVETVIFVCTLLLQSTKVIPVISASIFLMLAKHNFLAGGLQIQLLGG